MGWTFYNSSGQRLSTAASAGAVTREGGQTSEATSTSTSSVDLLTASSLTIGGTLPFTFSGGFRKTTGASASVDGGVKLNTTITADADNSGNKALYRTGAGNVADDGHYAVTSHPRVTNYLRSMAGYFLSVGNNTAQGSGVTAPSEDADSPTAEITDVVIRFKSGNSSVTGGLDDLQVYSYAIS